MPQPADDELLIRVKYVGICGSDIIFTTAITTPRTAILFCSDTNGPGSSKRPEKKAAGFIKGDMVTGDCSCFCGTCVNCGMDKNMCENLEKFGITIDGASAEYILRSTRHAYKAPPGSDIELLCLAEPLSFVARLIERIKAQTTDFKNKKVLVYGGGLIGMAALMLLKLREGCKNVDMFDLSEYRIEFGRALGANIPDEAALHAKADLDYHTLYNDTKYDIIIETTGNAGVFANAIRLARPWGIIGCIGMIDHVQIQQNLIIVKSLAVLGCIGSTGEFESMMAFLNEHGDAARKLISHRFPIGKASEAFAASQRRDEAMKVVLQV